MRAQLPSENAGLESENKCRARARRKCVSTPLELYRAPAFYPLGVIHVECLILGILELSVSLSVVLYGVPVFYPLEIIHVECLFFLESVNSSFL